MFDYCTAKARGLRETHAKNSSILDQRFSTVDQQIVRVYTSKLFDKYLPRTKMIRFQVSMLVVYRYPNSSVAENETVELQMLGYHRSPTERSKASGGSYVSATA